MYQGWRIVGVHPVIAETPVHLVELDASGDCVDYERITQEVAGLPKMNWQVPYDERVLADGHFAFFFHRLDVSKPLMTQAGALSIPAETPVPAHLQSIEYEAP